VLLWRGKDAIRPGGKDREPYEEIKGSKDSRHAGDRMRDKLSELLKAGAKTHP